MVFLFFTSSSSSSTLASSSSASPPSSSASGKSQDPWSLQRNTTKHQSPVRKAFSENVLFVSGLSSGHSCLSMKQVKYHKIVEELRRAQMSIFCAPGSFLHRAYGWNLTVNERLEFLNLWWGAFPYNFGFVHFSYSDQVRDDLHERPVDHHRVDHQAVDRVQVHRRRHVGRL